MDPTPSEMPSGSPGVPAPPPQAPTPPPQMPTPPPQMPPAASQTPPQPAWMQSLTSTAPVAGPAGLFYADLPNRIIAYIIDMILLAIVGVVIGAITGSFMPVVSFDLVNGFHYNYFAAIINAAIGAAVSAGYFIYTWTNMRGTVGMKVLGMQIGSEKDGSALYMDQAIRRWLAVGGWITIVSALNPWRPGRSYRQKATRNADAQRARDGTSRPSGTAAGTLQPQWRTIGLMPMKVREVIRLLEKHGWVEMRSRGSHRHFKHPDEAFVVTVPGSDGKELAPSTLNVILKKAGLR